MGVGKVVMVYWADDKYFEFLNQQVKELHMETRRRQVTGIQPTAVMTGSHTPATRSDPPTSKTLAEGIAQDEFVAKWPATLEKDPSEEPNPNNDLGELFVAEAQQSGRHISLICADAEEHEHLRNHLNEKPNAKIYDMFRDLLSNIYIDSIQETYMKISVYNKVIVQYMEETNIKYGLNLKFTKIRSPRDRPMGKNISGGRSWWGPPATQGRTVWTTKTTTATTSNITDKQTANHWTMSGDWPNDWFDCQVVL